MNRWILAGILGVIALITTVVSVLIQGRSALVELLPNLAAEIVGLALTVALVDWLIERAKMADEAQRMAWAMLHDIDHAVWVWQGGRREFHLDEMYALLDMVQEHEPIADSTQELLANLGVRASDNIRLQSRLLRRHRKLKAAMTSLSGLAQLREIKRLVDSRYAVDSLQLSIRQLAELTDQDIHPGQFGAAKGLRDATLDAQTRRYLGERGIMMSARAASEKSPSSIAVGAAMSDSSGPGSEFGSAGRIR
ncbi:MAG: hypothetical protein KF912_09785 [Phycisphaeraceae bacterium]|nr:hypothetical protein [Phycisphaeraceae bacterium]QYK46935.1 MAG: hypothetical protein KF838_09070 [Phycisphaeraceae bacterium]